MIQKNCIKPQRDFASPSAHPGQGVNRKFSCMRNPLKISPGVSLGEIFVKRVPLLRLGFLRLGGFMGMAFLKYGILRGEWKGG